MQFSHILRNKLSLTFISKEVSKFRYKVIRLFSRSLYKQQLCKKFKNLPKEQEQNLRLRRDEATGEVEIQCLLQRMDEWLQVRIIGIRKRSEKVRLCSTHIYRPYNHTITKHAGGYTSTGVPIWPSALQTKKTVVSRRHSFFI